MPVIGKQILILLIGGLMGLAAFGHPVRAETLQFTAMILQVDQEQKQLIVRNPANESRVRVAVTGETTILREDQKKTLADLKPGDLIDLELRLEEEGYLARRIVIKPMDSP